MGLTPPLPSPFEHCQKKLHYWFGRASLKTHTFYLKLSKEKSTGLPFPSCLLWCRDDVLFLNPPFSDNVGSRSRWVLYLRVHFCHIFLLSSLWPLPSHHLREFACAKRRGGRWGVGRCKNVSLFCFFNTMPFQSSTSARRPFLIIIITCNSLRGSNFPPACGKIFYCRALQCVDPEY